jgi:drug/metabolite transporter (DMT)-like permease
LYVPAPRRADAAQTWHAGVVITTVLLSLLAALLYGISDFAGAVGARRLRVLPGTTITYVSAFAALLIALPIVGGAWSGESVLWGAIAGVAAIAGFLAFYAALAAGPISLAAPLIAVLGSLVPVIIALAAGERLSIPAWIAIFLAIFGAALISVAKPGAPTGIPRKTIVLSVIAGILLGLSIVALDRAPQDSGVTAAVVEIAVGVVLLAVILGAARVSGAARRALSMLDEEQEEARLPSAGRARLASAGGGILLGIANALLLAALQSGSLAVVSVLIGLYPVGTILLARIVYQERLSLVQGSGVVVALAASVLLALS